MEDSKKKHRILILLFFGVLMGALDLSVVGPAIPAIEKSIEISGSDISRIFSIYLLFYLFGLPLLSKSSDVHGRRSIYIISLTLFALGSGLVSISHNLTQLLVGRAIQGFGSSGVFPVAAATIGDIFPVDKRGKVLGLLGAVYGIAFIIGPIIAGSILHFFSWNVIFLINLPVAAILIIFAIMLLPGKPTGEKPVINWRQKISFMNMEFFRYPQLRIVSIISFGLGLYQAGIVFLPKLAVHLFNITPSKASFLLLPLVTATAIVPLVFGWLIDKIGAGIVVVSGLIFAVISLSLFSLVSENILLFYIAEACFGFGIAIRSSLKYIVLGEVGPQVRARSLGMLIIFITIGQIIGAALIGVIISGSPGESSGFGDAFLILAVLTSALLILSMFLKKK